MDRSFFKEPTESSIVKTNIVTKYFRAWSNVIIPTSKINIRKVAYIDLFAGPGRYDDGTKSTPLKILEMATQNSNLQQMLVTVFNDKDENNTKSLQKDINNIKNISSLKYKPEIYTDKVGDNFLEMFENMKLIPTLFFIDPWGYKGLSLRLINSVLKNWGCDCIFFFNYNRIYTGLFNKNVAKHMEALFGKERTNKIRIRLKKIRAIKREQYIINQLEEALIEMGGKYVLPFCFQRTRKYHTSHYIIFVSKNFKGFEIMRGIMGKESSSFDQGVPSFAFNPIEKQLTMIRLFEKPMLDMLENLLLESFAGQTLKMRQIYIKHCVGTRYIESNYKEALRRLEKKDIIKADPPANKRQTRQGVVTFGNDVKVTFAKKDN